MHSQRAMDQNGTVRDSQRGTNSGVEFTHIAGGDVHVSNTLFSGNAEFLRLRCGYEQRAG
jgi:hypothetical protein